MKADEVTQFADVYDVSKEWILKGDSVLETASDPRIDIAARELRKLEPKGLGHIASSCKSFTFEQGLI